MYLYCAVVYVCYSVYHHLPRTTLLPGTYNELQELSLMCLFLRYTSTKKPATTVNNSSKENNNIDHKQN